MNYNKLFPLIFLLILGSLTVYAGEIGSNYENNCEGEICNLEIYSYQKYWENGNVWEEVNENWTDRGCRITYDYCVNKNKDSIQVNVKKTFRGKLVIRVVTPEGDSITYTPTQIEDSTGILSKLTVGNVVMGGNKLIYEDVFPNSDLVLKYLPSKIKEELIINSALPFVINGNLSFITEVSTSLDYDKNPRRETGDIEFSKKGVPKAIIPRGELGRNNAGGVSFGVQDNIISTEVEYNRNSQFPLIIDPTTELPWQKILEDGTATITTNNITGTPNIMYGKLISGETMSLGIGGCFNSSIKTSRAYMDWNLSNDAVSQIRILNATLVFVFSNVDDDINDINATNLNQHGIDIPLMTQAFFDDLGDGIYSGISDLTSVANYNISLNEDGFKDIENALSGDKIFSLGLINSETGTRPTCPTTDDSYTEIRSSEYSNAAHRPRLILQYGYIANETNGEAAIEQGILNSLPNSIIHNEQQVYTRSLSDVHEIGSFDKFSMFDTQRWGFNYVTGSEVYANMSNISDSFFVLEFANLTSSEITLKVEEFINSTRF